MTRLILTAKAKTAFTLLPQAKAWGKILIGTTVLWQ